MSTPDLDAISNWFAERGLGIRLTHEEDDLVWAELTSLSRGQVVAPMFGRGETAIEAASRAKQRFQQEQ